MSSKNYKSIKLPPKYVPKKSEPYMCPEHLAYFYQQLKARREEIVNNKDSVLGSIKNAEKESSEGVGDEEDIAVFEQEIAMSLHMSDRSSNLLKKIDAALQRIDDGTFGYSVISGEEIGLSRMLARPLATLTIEEQEEHEKKYKNS